VCTTELGAVAALKPEFDKRNTKVIGLSVDPVDSHRSWETDIEDVTGSAVNFPMIADPDRTVADLYDMIHPNASDTMTVRSGLRGRRRQQDQAHAHVPGEHRPNFDEILRVIDSLQLTAEYKVATPADWKDGDDVIITAAVSDEEAAERFPKGFEAKKPYLRLTPQPNK
jgi:alkyl hydroperoxide reductase subunit AhpC